MARKALTDEQKRDRFGDGPWMNEPDRIEWEASGLPCLMVRNDIGVWCGYAAVPPGHPLYGEEYDIAVDVHGGITYADRCSEERGICHVAKPGEPDDVWWFGFDCNHAWDLNPYVSRLVGTVGLGTYRDQHYVRAEVEKLAAQLAARG